MIIMISGTNQKSALIHYDPIDMPDLLVVDQIVQ